MFPRHENKTLNVKHSDSELVFGQTKSTARKRNKVLYVAILTILNLGHLRNIFIG